MKNFTKPTNLNGAELIEELAKVGLMINKIYDNSDGTISFDVNDETKAAEIVAQHNGTVIASELSVEAKLAALGLTADDLKALGLGGN